MVAPIYVWDVKSLFRQSLQGWCFVQTFRSRLLTDVYGHASRNVEEVGVQSF